MKDRNRKIFVGCRQFILKDKINEISFPVLVQYPTFTSSAPTNFGPYVMDVSPDADIISEEQFPLIIISHGNGGSHLLYRTISTYLVKKGYMVAMPEHYGNNRNNNELENSVRNLQLRPRHVSLTIDNLISESSFAENISTGEIAVIGHSMGGYTALALAGGNPWTKDGERIEVSADPRVKAIVLLAPGAGWFYHPANINKITVPILLLTAEHDIVTPGWNADIVLNIASDKSRVISRQIENAGHFSFLSPFPEAMRNPKFFPSTDPEGFDRHEFHTRLPVEIHEFLNENLRKS